MADKFRVMVTDIGILGTTLIDNLINHDNLSITVVDASKVSYEDVSSGAYPKKYFGRQRADVLKDKYGEKIRFLKKEVKEFKDEDFREVELLVSTSDEFNLDSNNMLNQLAFINNIKFLTARLIENNFAEVGPFVVPYQTACFKCYETRLKANLEDSESYFKRKLSFGDSYKIHSINTLKKITALLIEMEILHVADEKHPNILDKVISIDLKEHSMKADTIFKIPYCLVCDSK